MTTRGRTAALRVTPSYVLLLVASWAVLCIVADRATRDAVLQANSTDVANLLSGRIYSLATSAALVEGPGCLAVVAAAAGVLGFAERAWGPGRLVATFVLGHVGASVLVFAGLAAGLVAHAFRPGVATATDVGVSYGLLAVLGALLAEPGLPRPGLWQGTAVALVLGAAALGHTFTDVGHLVALLLGLAAGRASAHGRRVRSPADLRLIRGGSRSEGRSTVRRTG